MTGTVREYGEPGDLETLTQLLYEYEESLSSDLSDQDFDIEVAELPGAYAPPDGIILLANLDDVTVGCVCLKKLAEDVCEMKRLYVRPESRGHGIGSELAKSVLMKAKRIGYKTMKLSTKIEMRTAQDLYGSLGFVPTRPFFVSERDDYLFFELEL